MEEMKEKNPSGKAKGKTDEVYQLSKLYENPNLSLKHAIY